MKLFNTLTKQKEEFIPIEAGKVGMYHCGPTVYWYQHIGNMRAVFIVDTLVRTLQYMDFDTTLVRNYTDVGHLTGDNIGDADSGLDRMTKAVQREGLTPQAIADKYTEAYEADIKQLNVLQADHKTPATEHIQEMIDMVQTLLEKGFAYQTELAVYFDVSKAKDYTRLSGQNIEENISGTGHGHVTDTNKRNPADFSLWFFKAGDHAKALQTWPSPFTSLLVENGEGFPGWHIECSAMSRKYLGDTFDIHMGGIEHIPIHHTNEIAQSESATSKKSVNYWLHNEHLLVDNKKMAKSEGTSYLVADVIEKGFSPLALRYMFLQAHYRSKQNFTWEALSAAQNGLEHLYNQFAEVSQIGVGPLSDEYKSKFIAALEDDLNTPQALAIISEMMKSDIPDNEKAATLIDFDRVLGLKIIDSNQAIEIPAKIQDLLDQRAVARDAKDFTLSDQLRDQIADLGYMVKDTDKGQELKKK